MIRLEFIKGVGGVVNLINGVLKEIDRAEIANIEDIDRVIVDFREAMAVNETLKALEIAGYIVIFDTLANLQMYIDQVNLFEGDVFNPGRDGLRLPNWDTASPYSVKNQIVPHTYTERNVEQELIQTNKIITE